jgi:hypothetical protein
MSANGIALSASLQDVSAKGPIRSFHLVGSADCAVAFELGLASNSTNLGRVKDPASPEKDLVLRGPFSSSPAFPEASSFLRYKVLQGTVTTCWMEAAPLPSAGPQGAPGRLTPTAVKTANYAAAGGELVQCDPSGGAFTVTLPAANSVLPGTPIYVKNTTTSTTAITVAKTGADTVDGGSSGSIAASKGVLRLVSDGTSNWDAI